MEEEKYQWRNEATKTFHFRHRNHSLPRTYSQQQHIVYTYKNPLNSDVCASNNNLKKKCVSLTIKAKKNVQDLPSPEMTILTVTQSPASEHTRTNKHP